MATLAAVLLPLPFTVRKKVFNLLSESAMVAKIAYGFKIAFIFIAVLFVDALQRVLRVTAEADLAKQSSGHNAQSETSHAAKKFYAQRNLYLTAFTLFLAPCLTRIYYFMLDYVNAQDQYAQLKLKYDELSKSNNKGIESTEVVADLRRQLDSKTRDLGKGNVSLLPSTSIKRVDVVEALHKQLPPTDKKTT
ncbi:hypothetical protein FRB99_000066 [Tulasnella sp. 403]|nr:hypothetical protein FRB99_000066 [Tulasnella sp. 403]